MTLLGMLLLSMHLSIMLLPINKDDTIEHKFAKHDEAGDETHGDEATNVDSAVPTVVAIKDI